MNFGYIVRPKADRDIDNLADSIAERTTLDQALQFLSEIHATFALIVTQPEMGWHCKIKHPQLRTARTFRVNQHFNEFLIFYQPDAGHIEILRVLHGAQDLIAVFAKSDALD